MLIGRPALPQGLPAKMLPKFRPDDGDIMPFATGRRYYTSG